MEGIALVIGKVDEAIKKSIRTLKEMKKEDDEIMLTILPWVEMQEKMFKGSLELQRMIEIKLILNEEDFRDYMYSLEAQDVL